MACHGDILFRRPNLSSVFQCEIINDVERPTQEEKSYKLIPEVRKVSQQEIMDNYFQVKMDVKNIIETEVARLKKERSQ